MLSFKFPLSHVREVSFDRRSRSHHRTHKVRAAAASLASLEVAITRRGATLTRLQNIGVHPQAHRTSSLAPLKPRLVKNPIEPLAFRSALHFLRSGHHHRTHRRIDSVTLHDARRRAQVFDARVRARADKGAIDCYSLDIRAWLERHVFECPLRGLPVRRALRLRWIRHIT